MFCFVHLGFELKRRGELKLIKIFQSEVFDKVIFQKSLKILKIKWILFSKKKKKKFLDGETLKDCYGAVAAVAKKW